MDKIIRLISKLFMQRLGLARKVVATKHKKTQKVTPEDENEYREFVDNTIDILYSLDIKGNVTFVNRAIEKNYGFKVEEVVGKNFARWVHKKELPKMLKVFRKILSGEKLTAETILFDKEKKMYNVEFTSTPMIKDNKVVGTRGIIRDITTRKKTEEELRKSEQNFKLLVEGLKDVVLRVSLDGRIEYSSPVVKEFAGYDPQEEVGNFIAKYFVRKNELIQALQLIKKVAIDREPASIEFLFKPKDREPFYVEVTGRPIVEADKVVTIQCVMRDINKRKQAEEELKNAYAELKRTQAQLIQSTKMSGIGQLASGVAHEINNPLTGVLNNIQLIKKEIEQKKEINFNDFKELMDVIEESAARCKRIIQSLLDFSHPSRGLLQPLSLNEIVEKVINLIKHEIELENIIIQKQLQIDLPQIRGDSQLLQQAVFDIISNARWAIQKTKKEGGSITVKTEYDSQNKFVNMYISDTGIGIPKENIDRLFEPFFTTKKVGEGTGLGLAVVYNIIKEHKGDIRAESQVNEGATFKISLPAI